MKTYSVDELKALAEPLFKEYGVNKLYGVSDGQIFLSSSRAKLHAGEKKVHTLETTEAEAQPQSDEPVLSVKDLKEVLNTTTDIKALQDMLFKEVGGQNRKSAVEAIEKRMEAIAGKNSPEFRGESASASTQANPDPKEAENGGTTEPETNPQ